MTAEANGVPVQLRNGRTALHLHCHKRADGPNLLLLHELYGNAHDWAEAAAGWDGSVFALDFSGHGRSGWRDGGIYSPEVLAADADAALGELGDTFVAGAGVGAYAALLLAGGRPGSVRAALLLPGEGLAGGGAEPQVHPDREAFARLIEAHRSSADPSSASHDPRVVLSGSDMRPPDYARVFAERAKALLLAEDGTPRPSWWEHLRDVDGVVRCTGDLGSALGRLGNLV